LSRTETAFNSRSAVPPGLEERYDMERLGALAACRTGSPGLPVPLQQAVARPRQYRRYKRVCSAQAPRSI
jgi:hypothetical protein